ncbi:MAG: ilvI [Rickettsiales bacterium]|jgi:acetolactate synthase-1/2/3 large subunit|nr:ilvI [Rickettsiales bacterium]
MRISGAEIVIKSLVDQGVDTIFGYPGGACLPIYDALFKQNELRHILVRHEQAAVHAAEGYARSTGKVGAVLVTSGPGATNTVTGLTDAMLDSIPVICISGQVATHIIGSDGFQEADVTGITRACTKHNYLVNRVEDLAHVMHEAIHIARTGRPGPVVVDVPKDVQVKEAEYNGVVEFKRASYKSHIEPSQAAIEEAVELMAKAKRPIFYVGGGVINSGEKACDLLTQFARMTGFPVTNTLMALGAYPASDRQYIGMLGMHGTLEANMAMHDCDVMINIGARFDDRITGRLDAFSPGSKKIHVDIDASSINKNVMVDTPIIGDAGDVIAKMMDVWKKRKYTADTKALDSWWKQIGTWQAKKSVSYNQQGDVIKPQFALDRLKALTQKKDTYITTDVGQHQMWAAQYLAFDKPKHWMTSGGLGTMGYGLPAAAGVQIAHPQALTVCVTGEASIMMNIQELSTIVQYRLPVKVFILNNQYMGMVRQWQELFFGNRYSESYMDALPDFVALAEAFGIKGMRVEKASELDRTIEAMIAHNGPVVADIRVDKAENVYPMIPAGAAHNEVELGPDDRIAVDEANARTQV